MSSLLPFCALRPEPSRIDPGAALLAWSRVDDERNVPEDQLRRVLEREPRSAVQLLVGPAAARTTRARLHLAQWRRAGVWQRDPRPALYVWRQGREGSCVGVFAVDARNGPRRTGEDVAAAVVPRTVVVQDPRRRIARTIDNETSREPDVSFEHRDVAGALWIVDDEDVVGRLTALLQDGATAPIPRDPDAKDGVRDVAADDAMDDGKNDDERGSRAAAACAALVFCVLEHEPCAPPIGVVVAPVGALS